MPVLYIREPRRSQGILCSTWKPLHFPRVAHYLCNFSEGIENRPPLLDAMMWEIGGDERYRDALAPGDVAMMYVATVGEFIDRAELATAAHEWTASEAEAYPGDSPSGVLLSEVEEWGARRADGVRRGADRPDSVEQPVQANAPAGFRMGVVRITGDEFESTLALSREARET